MRERKGCGCAAGRFCGHEENRLSLTDKPTREQLSRMKLGAHTHDSTLCYMVHAHGMWLTILQQRHWASRPAGSSIHQSVPTAEVIAAEP